MNTIRGDRRGPIKNPLMVKSISLKFWNSNLLGSVQKTYLIFTQKSVYIVHRAVTCMITSPINEEVGRFGVNFHNCNGSYIFDLISYNRHWQWFVVMNFNFYLYFEISVEVIQDLCRVGMYRGRPHILWIDDLVMDEYSIQRPAFSILALNDLYCYARQREELLYS